MPLLSHFSNTILSILFLNMSDAAWVYPGALNASLVASPSTAVAKGAKRDLMKSPQALDQLTFDHFPCVNAEFMQDPTTMHQLYFVPSNKSSIRRTRGYGDGSYGLILSSYGLMHSIMPGRIVREGNVRIRFHTKPCREPIEPELQPLLETLEWIVRLINPDHKAGISCLDLIFVVSSIPMGDSPLRSNPQFVSAWDWLFRNRYEHDVAERIRISFGFGPTAQEIDNKV